MLKKNVDCLVLGDVLFDVTVILENKINPIITGGTTNCKSMSISPGGSGNIAVTLSKLGGKSALCGMIGDDILGNLYQHDLEENNVIPILFRHKNKPTGILSAFVSHNGQRSFLVSRGANSYLKHHHIDKAFQKVNPKLLYIPGHSLTDKSMHDSIIYASKLAIKKKIKIVFACTPYNLIKLNRSKFLKLLKITYCLCLNLEEARALTGKKKLNVIVKQLMRNVNLLALTLGEKGCIIANNDQLVRIPAPKVKAVDTTGAGDAFAASIIFGITKKINDEQMGKLGVKMATLAVQQSGPRLYQSKIKISKFYKQ